MSSKVFPLSSHPRNFLIMNIFVSLARPCFDTGTFSDVVTGTCQSCPVECVEGCTGSLVVAGEGGCNICSVLLLTRNGEQV